VVLCTVKKLKKKSKLEPDSDEFMLQNSGNSKNPQLWGGYRRSCCPFPTATGSCISPVRSQTSPRHEAGRLGRACSSVAPPAGYPQEQLTVTFTVLPSNLMDGSCWWPAATRRLWGCWTLRRRWCCRSLLVRPCRGRSQRGRSRTARWGALGSGRGRWRWDARRLGGMGLGSRRLLDGRLQAQL
jgi:hypothetical protein